MAFSPSSRKKDRKIRLLFFCGFVALALVCVYGVPQVLSHRGAVIYIVCLLAAFAAAAYKLMIVRDSRIPVFAFHSVTDDAGWLADDSIAISVETFERIVAYLDKRGYSAASLRDLRKHNLGQRRLPEKTVILTFDDGLLDNWVAAYPILKKHRKSATIFVPTDLIDCGDDTRRTLIDVWEGKIPREQLQWRKHLNWHELKAMESDGVFDVQCHTMTHTFLPVFDRIDGFQTPGEFVVWRTVGAPVYARTRAHMAEKAFKPSADLAVELHRHVLQNGMGDFFHKPGWRAELQEICDAAESRGEWETDEEACERICDELAGSKSVLESRLNKKIRYLCWPGDEYTPELEENAAKYGYLATTALDGFNRFGEDSKKIYRLYAPAFRPVFKAHTLNYWSFVISLKLFRGNYFYYIPLILLNAAIRLINRTRRGER